MQSGISLTEARIGVAIGNNMSRLIHFINMVDNSPKWA
jgi:hypothetical protein